MNPNFEIEILWFLAIGHWSARRPTLLVACNWSSVGQGGLPCPLRWDKGERDIASPNFQMARIEYRESSIQYQALTATKPPVTRYQ